MAPVIITMVRHGESKDNLTALWAGHRDAPLSNHGYNQALRLGQAFADVPITAIYASDLKRANTTARAIYDANKTSPKPPFTTSPLLREQFFGEAEGEPWDAGKFNSVHLPWEDHRAFRIAPNAESLNDVAARADLVLRHFVLPHVVATAAVPPGAGPPQQHHIVLVAHGIWLSEMLFALKRTGDPRLRYVKQGGYVNTGWARIELELDDPAAVHALSPGATSPRDEFGTDARKDDAFSSPPAPSEAAPAPSSTVSPASEQPSPSSSSSSPDAPSTDSSPRPPLPPHLHSLLPTLPPVPPRDPSLPPAWPHASSPPAAHPVPMCRHRVVAFNQAEHLVGLKRTKGGVGSGAWDEKQKGLKEFFGGGGGGGGGGGAEKQ
ncbi:histidine phosphatase family protein [Rhodotorula paludigena]|uniref:histidine phosphatase family protein n=1 Tax=Rhodotorula paludigena TaxID=86838 RepID=UPI003178C7F8